MVVQEYALFPHMSAAANVGFGLRSLDRDSRDARVGEALELVQLEKLGSRHPSELSGGQQQRVALARTLAPNPVTVLLDEPFSNLDSSMRQQLRQEVESILRSQRTAAVLVTHDREEAFAIADRVGVMIEGKLLQIDSPERIYHFPVTRDVAGLTGPCDFIPGEFTGPGDVETELGTLNCRSAAGRMDDGQSGCCACPPRRRRVDTRCERAGDNRGSRVSWRSSNSHRSPRFRGDYQVASQLIFDFAGGFACAGSARQDNPVRRLPYRFDSYPNGLGIIPTGTSIKDGRSTVSDSFNAASSSSASWTLTPLTP